MIFSKETLITIQLQGFQELQEAIFGQLNEKMKAMDRSLLEKIAADIEMMDKEEGTELVYSGLNITYLGILYDYAIGKFMARKMTYKFNYL